MKYYPQIFASYTMYLSVPILGLSFSLFKIDGHVIVILMWWRFNTTVAVISLYIRYMMSFKKISPTSRWRPEREILASPEANQVL